MHILKALTAGFSPDIADNKEFYLSTEVRPPFTYASLIRQVSRALQRRSFETTATESLFLISLSLDLSGDI